MTRRLPIYLLMAAAFCVTVSRAQVPSTASTPTKPGSSAQSEHGGEQTPASSPGFSIETEMFTYKALGENSEVVACDVARYLYGGDLTDAPKDSHAPCVIKNAARSTPGIVILSSSSTLLSDFQVWRADMATMSDLEARADKVCTVPTNSNNPPQGTINGTAQTQPPTAGQKGASGTSGLLDFTPAGQAVSLIGDALRMFTTTQSVSAVAGTVHDQALMNEVARQLRSMNVLVLMPEIYSPNALNRADYAESPYFQNLEKTFDSYQDCEKAQLLYPATDPKKTAINIVINAIDNFQSNVMPASQSSKTSGGKDPNQETQTPSTTSSHFAKVLAADDLATQMGFHADGSGPSPTWQHVLWLKALESGGSVSQHSSIFATKVWFSGGAVDTYAIFRMDGELVCSGNVYNFQSPVRTSDLAKSFRAKPATTTVDSPLLSTTCAPLSK